ncbi:hypothetical protein J6590_033893 [Homalodisca vitripennis]|nr:hypothetical protein J6590_033893 [Homalodisca vitripennis]
MAGKRDITGRLVTQSKVSNFLALSAIAYLSTNRLPSRETGLGCTVDKYCCAHLQSAHQISTDTQFCLLHE